MHSAWRAKLANFAKFAKFVFSTMPTLPRQNYPFRVLLITPSNTLDANRAVVHVNGKIDHQILSYECAACFRVPFQASRLPCRHRSVLALPRLLTTVLVYCRPGLPSGYFKKTRFSRLPTISKLPCSTTNNNSRAPLPIIHFRISHKIVLEIPLHYQ